MNGVSNNIDFFFLGGTRRIVLLLQDGTFMMTEMHDDEFKALNIGV